MVSGSITNDPGYIAGQTYAQRGEYSDSVVALEGAIARCPEDPEGYYALGMTHQERAIRLMPPSMRERPDRTGLSELASAILGLGVVATSRAIGQTDWIRQYRTAFRRSVDAFEHALVLSPDDFRIYKALSLSLRYLGRTDDAADAARRAASLAPHDASLASKAESYTDAADRESRARGPQSQIRAMTWDDVVLPEKTKRELRQMQLLLENVALARDLGIEPPTGLLLYGPPGTGKTTIARVLAWESKCSFLAASPAEINSMWLGESEKSVKRLFDEARAKTPAIVFLDEIDALLPSRSGGVNLYSDKVVNQFLHEMDGLRTNRRIFVIGATNRKELLDPALLRGGRLSRSIEIPLPDLPSRRSLFGLYLADAKCSDDIDLDKLAETTEGFSGANIKAAVNEAGLQALIRLADADPKLTRELNSDDFDVALKNFKPTTEEPTNPWKMFM
jgi:transitional endoplasmic reticulum ATPase